MFVLIVWIYSLILCMDCLFFIYWCIRNMTEVQLRKVFGGKCLPVGSPYIVRRQKKYKKKVVGKSSLERIFKELVRSVSPSEVRLSSEAKVCLGKLCL